MTELLTLCMVTVVLTVLCAGFVLVARVLRRLDVLMEGQEQQALATEKLRRELWVDRLSQTLKSHGTGAHAPAKAPKHRREKRPRLTVVKAAIPVAIGTAIGALRDAWRAHPRVAYTGSTSTAVIASAAAVVYLGGGWEPSTSPIPNQPPEPAPALTAPVNQTGAPTLSEPPASATPSTSGTGSPVPSTSPSAVPTPEPITAAPSAPLATPPPPATPHDEDEHEAPQPDSGAGAGKPPILENGDDHPASSHGDDEDQDDQEDDQEDDDEEGPKSSDRACVMPLVLPLDIDTGGLLDTLCTR